MKVNLKNLTLRASIPIARHDHGQSDIEIKPLELKFRNFSDWDSYHKMSKKTEHILL